MGEVYTCLTCRKIIPAKEVAYITVKGYPDPVPIHYSLGKSRGKVYRPFRREAHAVIKS